MYCIQKVLKFNELTFFIFHKLYLFTIPPMAEEDAPIKPVPFLRLGRMILSLRKTHWIQRN